MIHPLIFAAISSPSSRRWSLRGIDGSPASVTKTSLGGNDANAAWGFCGTSSVPNSLVAGYEASASYNSGDTAVYTGDSAFITPIDNWGTAYIKATQTGVTSPGDPPTTGTLDSWLSLAYGGGNIFWKWTETSNVGGETSGTIRVDIATNEANKDGSIVATGYYKGTATTEP